MRGAPVAAGWLAPGGSGPAFSMRFRPDQHLRRQRDFRAIREQGHRYNCGAFTFAWRQRAPEGDLESEVRRVAVVASIASVGVAVRRNRAKRRLREIFRRHQERVPAGCDVVLTARSAAVSVPLPEMERKFLEACAKIVPARTS